MNRERSSSGTHGPAWSGLSAILLITAIYFYFLIFAQFGFLGLLQERVADGWYQKWNLSLMAVAGLAGSLSAAWAIPRWGALLWLRLGLAMAALAAALTLEPSSLIQLGPIAVGIGLGVGWSTVSLITLLPTWLGTVDWGWKLGLGTGLAYGLCNCPPIFQAEPLAQAMMASAAAGIGLSLTWLPAQDEPSPESTESRPALPLWMALISFVILVWYDSAAFYIIQQTDSLKGATWGEGSLLYRNALIHLLAAATAGWVLSRQNLRWMLLASLGCLVLAGHFVNREATRVLGGGLYPLGVSVYSVALLGYPAFLSGAVSCQTRAQHAAWIYAVAGWIASAMGIGMAENLDRIPYWFIAPTLLLMIGLHGWSWCRHRFTEMAVLAALALFAWMRLPAGAEASPDNAPTTDLVARGRQVYLSEGCIHCHSQYVRPGTRDEELWGPVQNYGLLLTNAPPLFGNRRQGPDLLRVANRRSSKWLEQHFLAPQSLSHHSAMPSYAYLFQDERGPALIAYLESLARGTLLDRARLAQSWQPPTSAAEPTAVERGHLLFHSYCAPCHGAEGQGHGDLSQLFPRSLGPLADGHFVRAPATMPPAQRQAALARLIKFGIPGTEMPGHEYLSNSDIACLIQLMSGWSPRHDESTGR